MFVCREHGGIFPHARVQQVCTKPDWRRHKVASALIDALICDLERAGFLTVKAKVADDLAHAQAFYEQHKFEAVSSKAGGSTRGRTIVVRVRNLATPHLFSTPPTEIDFGLPKRFGTEAAFYTFDLNIFFDLVKNRRRHDAACALFGAALDHRIRLGVASEFVNELRRTSVGLPADPVLQMALQLPRLPPPVNAHHLEHLASEIHEIVFTNRGNAGAGTVQAHSDSRHLAHSALSRVSGFVTSDGALLEARDDLLAKIGIDVAGLDELLALLPDHSDQHLAPERRGENFECRAPSTDEATAYLKSAGVPESLIEEVHCATDRMSGWRSAIWEGSNIVALACLASPVSTAGEDRLLINVNAGHLDRELYAEYLLDAAIKQACLSHPAVIRLLNVPGQPTVNALATARGFVASGGTGYDLVKVAIGGPLTEENWESVRHSTRRKTGLRLPTKWPDFQKGPRNLAITNGSGQPLLLSPERFEDMFGPTLYLWPGREAVLVPIQRAYADELLGTNAQSRLAFIKDRDASFLSRRAYVNTPRARNSMRAGLPILFYESGKSGGRGAVVAAGRIVDSVLVSKETASGDTARRAVVDDLSEFSATDDVLMTTFDNLTAFPSPVRFSTLKTFGAVGSSNLISATQLSHQNLVRIVEAGWSK